MSGNRALALRLAAAGYVVFPCIASDGPDNKNPLVRWQREGPHDPVKSWKRFPNAPPAIDLERSGLFALDGDRHEGGQDGVEVLKGLLREHGTKVRAHPVVRTPGGGVHVYFRQIDPPLRGSRGDLPHGIDAKGAGGCIMAPGAEMLHGKVYRPVEGCLSILERDRIPIVPQWVIDLVRPYREPLPPPPPPRDKTQYAMAVLRGECDAVRMACNGVRQNVLNVAAFKIGLKLVAAGHITPNEAEQWLLQAAEANGLIAADGQYQVRQTIASGLRGGVQKGR